MKVLQIYKDYYPPTQGGIERHVNRLANGLQKRGIEVVVLVSNTKPMYEDVNIEGIRVVKAPQLLRISSAPINMRMASLFYRLGCDADILHFHLPNPTADMAYLFSRLSRPKIIATYHSDVVRQQFLNRLYAPFFRHFLDKAAAILATSPNYVKSSKFLCGYKEKCHVVPLGINIARFNACCDDGRIGSIRQDYGPEIVLFIGKFRYYKGLDVLIRAMRKTGGKLLLIGSGPYEPQLKKLTADMGMSGRVFFLGERGDEEVNAFLKACDIFVLPSIYRSEAFGLAQLEAMACGRPVISTELATGTSYVNKHNSTGIVVPPGDTDMLAHSINTLMKDPCLREKYGTAGMCRVQDYFNEEQMIDNVLEIYRRVSDFRETAGPAPMPSFHRQSVYKD